MLNQDYWLAEFLPISRLLKKAPGQYARSFIYTEQDDADLTYFVIHHLQIIERAVSDLQEYLKNKVAETKRLQESLARPDGSARAADRSGTAPTWPVPAGVISSGCTTGCACRRVCARSRALTPPLGTGWQRRSRPASACT
jgi:hypothetical protein